MKFEEKNNEKQGNVAFKAHFKSRMSKNERQDMFIKAENEERRKRQPHRRRSFQGIKVPIIPLLLREKYGLNS